MKYLDSPQLLHLTNAYLSGTEIGGDKAVWGRVEAYSFKKTSADKRISKQLDTHFKACTPPPDSPLFGCTSPMSTTDSGRKLLVDLVLTMSESFPDYDFSSISPERFTKEKTDEVVNTINELLCIPMSKVVPNFRQKCWKAIDEVIGIANCEVYSYSPDLAEDDFGDVREASCFSFDYFFVNPNPNVKKIVYFTCTASSKLHMRQSQHDDEALDLDLEDEVGPLSQRSELGPSPSPSPAPEESSPRRSPRAFRS